jgi:type II secretory pathway predicted ATPase ExeA
MITVDSWLRHFNLTRLPFSRSVPEDGLLQHKSFSETFMRLQWAVQSKTPCLLIAEPGLGKSTLLGYLSDKLDQRHRVIYTALCSCGPYSLLGNLATRYGIKPKRTAALTAQVMLDELAKSNRNEILILDEAHRLPSESLDELRLISNLDFDRTPPFSMILAGQPELRETLKEPEHNSLWQRLNVRTSLAPLSDRETQEYVDQRLRSAGATTRLFLPSAMDKLFERTRGVPRLINNLATGALLAAAIAGKKHVDLPEVENASFDQENA